MINFLYFFLKESVSNVEKNKNNLQQQVADLQARLEQAQGSTLAGGKRIVQKLEERVK